MVNNNLVIDKAVEVAMEVMEVIVILEAITVDEVSQTIDEVVVDKLCELFFVYNENLNILDK